MIEGAAHNVIGSGRLPATKRNNFTVGEQRHKELCRICKSRDMTKFLELGPMPLANGFLTESDLEETEQFFPVNVYFCGNCNLAQLADIVQKEEMFNEYAYFSSVSKTFVDHSEKLATEIKQRFLRSSSPFVVEIGSNDGVFLKPLSKMNVRTLGVEPAANVAVVAREAGIDTIAEYFTTKLGAKIVQENGKADAVVACNVFNHIDDLDDVMQGISSLLKDDGVFVIEVPYLVDLIDNKSFDTMYHEMHSYFAVRPLSKLFEKNDMKIIDVKRIPIHTGSIRVYVRKATADGRVQPSVAELVNLELRMGLNRLETYMGFAETVKRTKEELVRVLSRLKREGKRIVGYGAPAKGNVLLNYCGIGTNFLDYIVDATPYKQGRFTPGTHIPIFATEKFGREKPPYALLLPWNFKEEILSKEKDYMRQGGKFILPLPEPVII